MAMEYKEGDLVWAKMKGFSSWPGLVSEPNKFLMKQPRTPGSQCIYFFGTKNFGWIEKCKINPYFEYKNKFITGNKSASFQAAVREIEELIELRKTDPNYKPNDLHKAEIEFDKLKEIEQEYAVPKTKKKTVKRTKISKTPAKKSKTDEEDSENSVGFVNHITKNYEELLNRPTVLERPDTPPMDINTISDTLRNKNIEASPLTFGFIGLGIMGSGIVKNLINSGHKVNLWSRRYKKACDLNGLDFYQNVKLGFTPKFAGKMKV